MDDKLKMLISGTLGLTLGAVIVSSTDLKKHNELYNEVKTELSNKEERIEVLEKKLEEAEPYLLYKIDQQLLKEYLTLEWMKENE